MSSLNEGALAYAARRTVAALADIERAKAALLQEVRTGEISQRCNPLGQLVIGHADVSILAGRNPNFLNGPKHAETTKKAVELFLSELRDLFKEHFKDGEVQKLNVRKSLPAAKNITSDPVQADLEAKLRSVQHELAELRERHERVTTYVHHWANELRAVRAENRLLRAQREPTVVPLNTLQNKRRKPSRPPFDVGAHDE